MYQVIFQDAVFGIAIYQFDSFNDAMEYWNFYADTPTCEAGELKDLDNNEIIWRFE